MKKIILLCVLFGLLPSYASSSKTLTYPDGSKYAGQVEDGKANGEGTMTYDLMGKYVGEWKDDKMHGQGTLYDSYGRILQKGTFRDGEYIGK
ncbi:MAG: hypothetical protein FWF73_08005 [Spirochaetes bacterium]|nr:hypothetical protein [Spirochaetota bacterium]